MDNDVVQYKVLEEKLNNLEKTTDGRCTRIEQQLSTLSDIHISLVEITGTMKELVKDRQESDALMKKQGETLEKVCLTLERISLKTEENTEALSKQEKMAQQITTVIITQRGLSDKIHELNTKYEDMNKSNTVSMGEIGKKILFTLVGSLATIISIAIAVVYALTKK
jgi:methyl-accepting chemotaxis protein